MAFYAKEEHRKVFEIEWEHPHNPKEAPRSLANPEAYVVSQMKRRQVDSKKHLSPEELKEFHAAKGPEVRHLLSSGCFEAVQGRVPEESKILGMRWLLAWKHGEQYSNGRKAKARGVILGYQDPLYSPDRAVNRFGSSATGRSLNFGKMTFLEPFYNKRTLEEKVRGRPVKEIVESMGLEEGTPLLMRKAAYGLAQAPLVWFESVNETLQALGYRQLKVEACCWVWMDKEGVIKSMIHSHVNDLMFAGKEQCPIHQNLMDKLKAKFNWGIWEETEFIQCGIHVKQKKITPLSCHRGSTLMAWRRSMSQEIEQARLTEATVTEEERKQLRTALGSVAWLCGQTCFIYSADVNFLVTTIPAATIGELLKTNQLIRDIKKIRDFKFKIHAFPEEEELEIACWADAGWANRPNGKDSTEDVPGAKTRN